MGLSWMETTAPAVQHDLQLDLTLSRCAESVCGLNWLVCVFEGVVFGCVCVRGSVCVCVDAELPAPFGWVGKCVCVCVGFRGRVQMAV